MIIICNHLAITKSCDKLKRLGYIDYEMLEVRHYRITQKAIDTFFADEKRTVVDEIA